MAFLGKPKDQEQYGRLMGMISPEATPSKRIGTEAPTGAVGNRTRSRKVSGRIYTDH
jgi:regulator of extracellular matrix RemA (YlzA/DUF370 family)